MKNKNLLGLSCEELIQFVVGLGEKPFRGKQLFNQIYRRRVFDFDQMTDLAKNFRERLKGSCQISLPEIETKFHSSDGTIKMLLRLEDGLHVETVYIPEESRDTLCISSQVGCDVGCSFCMTAQMGFKRNLRPGEIVGQVLRALEEGYVQDSGFNVVFMGMGEPLYNYKNVMKAFRLLIDSEGLDLSYRKITLSTSGVVPVLRLMAKEPVVPNLAISLNATLTQTRDRIMPINLKWNMQELLDTCREFPLDSRRRITIEYVLLRGQTDTDHDAYRLARLLHGIPAKVNLIPYNANPGLPHESPSPDRVENFQRILGELNMAVTVRKTRGNDVSAACGQLAYMKKLQELPENQV